MTDDRWKSNESPIETPPRTNGAAMLIVIVLATLGGFIAYRELVPAEWLRQVLAPASRPVEKQPVLLSKEQQAAADARIAELDEKLKRDLAAIDDRVRRQELEYRSKYPGAAEVATATAAKAAPSSPKGRAMAPADGPVVLSDVWFQANGVGATTAVTVTIRSALDVPVQAVRISCSFVGSGGFTVAEKTITVRETIWPRGTRRVNGISLGIPHDPVLQPGCVVKDYETG